MPHGIVLPIHTEARGPSNVRRVDQAKQDGEYLRLRRSGLHCTVIARRYKVSLATVYRGIERARLLEKPVGAEHYRRPGLVPLAPLTPLTPLSTCPHRGPLRKGSVFVCLVCHQSGMDHLKYFRPHPDDTKPDKKPAAKAKPKTRRQKRTLLERVEPSHN